MAREIEEDRTNRGRDKPRKEIFSNLFSNLFQVLELQMTKWFHILEILGNIKMRAEQRQKEKETRRAIASFYSIIFF